MSEDNLDLLSGDAHQPETPALSLNTLPDHVHVEEINEEALIQELAKLPILQYERRREGAAQALNIRPTVLDKVVSASRKELAGESPSATGGGCILFEEITPWPSAVDGAALLSDTYALLSRYVIADRETLRAATLWAALTWFADYATVLPLAVITAPEKGCGKSTLLTALAKLACNPLYASNITPAALFRAVEAWKPTLMIDETDSFMKDNEELRGIINSGHTRETAVIVRVVEVGGELQPRAFSTWGPKALAGIGHLPETLMSRAVILTMRRKMKGESAENLRHPDGEAFTRIKRQLARWSIDSGAVFAGLSPELEGLNNRAADNWEPLLALADIAGGEWPKMARFTALHINGKEDEAPSLNEELLQDVKDAFDLLGTEKIYTADLLDALCKDEESAWATYNRGRPVTARQLSKRLGEFGIKPRTVRAGFDTKKGYSLDQFKDAFTRYLPSPPNLSVTPSQPFKDGVSGNIQSVTKSFLPQDVTDDNTTKKPPLSHCYVVTDKTVGVGSENQIELDVVEGSI